MNGGARVFSLFALTAIAAFAQDRAFMSKYCVACHNSKVKTSGLDLVSLMADPVAQHGDKWERVVKKLRARYMPPPAAPRPDEKAYQSAVHSLESALDAVSAAKLNPGRTDTFRRLNRTEYRNVVRDLLALDIDVSSLLPSDESSHGFDNITVGDLSPTLLERYLTAAQRIARRAIGTPAKPGGETVQTPADLTQEEHFEELPLGTRGGLVIPYTFPLNAEYEFVIRLARDRNEHIEGLTDVHDVELMLDGERVRLFTVRPPPQGQDHSLSDAHLKIRLKVKAGPHMVAAAFPKKRSALLETERQPYQAHFNMDRHPRPQPAVYSITINGPYEAEGPGDTPSRRRIFICRPSSKSEENACAKKILANLTRRAYRRPVNENDLATPLKFYREARAEGNFETGIEMALNAVLISPEFLFRVEQDPSSVAPHSAYRVSDLELASRLSFFLWSSIPDDELLDVAARGKLKEPAVLEHQVRRMLTDQRSQALVNNFADQWLYLRNLASTTPDMRTFPDFDDNLRRSFRKETELFFESIMREDRNVLDLIRANYTFVDGRLAKHYGIPNVYGSRFRKVEFPEGGERGGLLRQGSVLTVTSYATRTTPVIRGKWVLDNLLGLPPPAPPPAVPALKENATGQKLTMRQRMAQHRENPVCASCHQFIDPVGFAFENYDAVGRYRSAENGTPVDVSGSLPDGVKFEGIAGLEKALMNRPDAFLTTFTEKLLTYGLGRGVEYYDAPAVRKIVKQAQSQDLRFSSFILGIATSTPFQMRRSQ